MQPLTNAFFSEESQTIAQVSAEIVFRYHHDTITREHILLAFFETSLPAISKLFEYLKIDVIKIRSILQDLVSNRFPVLVVSPINIFLDRNARRFIEDSRIETDRLGEKLISSQTLLLALIESYFSGPHIDLTMQKLVLDFGLTPNLLRRALVRRSYWET